MHLIPGRASDVCYADVTLPASHSGHKCRRSGRVFEIPVVNQTQVEVEDKVDEEKERGSNNVGATNERGMELLHLLRETEITGPVRDIGPVEENLETPTTDNLAEVSSDGIGTNQEGRGLVSKRGTPSSSGANGEGERE